MHVQWFMNARKDDSKIDTLHIAIVHMLVSYVIFFTYAFLISHYCLLTLTVQLEDCKLRLAVFVSCTTIVH